MNTIPFGIGVNKKFLILLLKDSLIRDWINLLLILRVFSERFNRLKDSSKESVSELTLKFFIWLIFYLSSSSYSGLKESS